jgi:hypothetical protein
MAPEKKFPLRKDVTGTDPFLVRRYKFVHKKKRRPVWEEGGNFTAFDFFTGGFTVFHI